MNVIVIPFQSVKDKGEGLRPIHPSVVVDHHSVARHHSGTVFSLCPYKPNPPLLFFNTVDWEREKTGGRPAAV